MIFCGRSACGGRNTLDHTPTKIDNIEVLTIQNGIFDELYATRDVDYEYTSVITNMWDWDTIMHAYFRDNLYAGNVDYSPEEISFLRIKRREKGTYDWVTLFEVPIDSREDLRFERFDRYARAKTEYEYAMLPVSNNIEGSFNISSVYSDFMGLYIMEKEVGFWSCMDLNFSYQKNRSTEVVPTIECKYPFIVSNGNSNYYSGTVNGWFVELIRPSCTWDIENGWRYRDRLMEFLQDGQAKILKYENGGIWLIHIVGSPMLQAQDHPDKALISFDWTESGNSISIQDLYYNNLIDVNPEWWVVRA